MLGEQVCAGPEPRYKRRGSGATLLVVMLLCAGRAGLRRLQFGAFGPIQEAGDKAPPKADFEQLRLLTSPNDGISLQDGIKPGHWTGVVVEDVANNFDFRGQLTWNCWTSAGSRSIWPARRIDSNKTPDHAPQGAAATAGDDVVPAESAWKKSPPTTVGRGNDAAVLRRLAVGVGHFGFGIRRRAGKGQRDARFPVFLRRAGARAGELSLAAGAALYQGSVRQDAPGNALATARAAIPTDHAVARQAAARCRPRHWPGRRSPICCGTIGSRAI